MKRSLYVLAGALALLAASVPVAGLDLESHCLDCHRPTQMRGQVPLIEGQHAEYLRAQLADFRDLHRQGFPMTALAAGMDEQSIEEVVQALSVRPWRRSARPVSRRAADRGGSLVVALSCESCHGNDFLGADRMPRLAGQTAGYLRRQISAFADGERQHPLSDVDGRIYALDEEQIRDIAAYLHSLP